MRYIGLTGDANYINKNQDFNFRVAMYQDSANFYHTCTGDWVEVSQGSTVWRNRYTLRFRRFLYALSEAQLNEWILLKDKFFFYNYKDRTIQIPYPSVLPDYTGNLFRYFSTLEYAGFTVEGSRPPVELQYEGIKKSFVIKDFQEGDKINDCFNAILTNTINEACTALDYGTDLPIGNAETFKYKEQGLNHAVVWRQVKNFSIKNILEVWTPFNNDIGVSTNALFLVPPSIDKLMLRFNNDWIFSQVPITEFSYIMKWRIYG